MYATCALWVGWGFALRICTQLMEQMHLQHCPRRENELWRLHKAIKCPYMARVTSIHNSLARIHHKALPNHKRAKKCNPSMCSAGAQPEIFDKQH
jgi:hypothetical protein